MRTALEKLPIRVTGVSLNSKHFYLLLSPHKVGEMSRWMQRLLTFRRTLTVRSLSDGLLRDAPFLKHAQQLRHGNGIASAAELNAIQHSLARGASFDDIHWQPETAAMLASDSSLRPRGRPER